MNVLYLSYDGMTDPLGQSQVIPYLRGLTKLGYRFTLLSFEKPERYKKDGEFIAMLLQNAGIEWQPLMYTKRPPVLSTLYDAYRMSKLAFALHRKKRFSIVHCRSYISALIGQQLKRKAGVRFVFDMRGFYADERVDGGIWNLRNPVYRAVYNYFKRKEKEFLLDADHIISLTYAACNQLQSRHLRNVDLPITVIPCCADLELFNGATIATEKKKELKAQLGIGENTFVLGYLGSIGTWYLPNEMMDFFKCLLQQRPDACFLFITTEPRDYLLKLALERGIPSEKIIKVTATHTGVPAYLSLCDWSIFFIKPVFSKMASSATKQGEIMGMGIPHVCNSGIGDISSILKNGQSGIAISGFDTATYKVAIHTMLTQKFNPAEIRANALHFYALESGIKTYAGVYAEVNKR